MSAGWKAAHFIEDLGRLNDLWIFDHLDRQSSVKPGTGFMNTYVGGKIPHTVGLGDSSGNFCRKRADDPSTQCDPGVVFARVFCKYTQKWLYAISPSCTIGQLRANLVKLSIDSGLPVYLLWTSTHAADIFALKDAAFREASLQSQSAMLQTQLDRLRNQVARLKNEVDKFITHRKRIEAQGLRADRESANVQKNCDMAIAELLPRAHKLHRDFRTLTTKRKVVQWRMKQLGINCQILLKP